MNKHAPNRTLWRLVRALSVVLAAVGSISEAGAQQAGPAAPPRPVPSDSNLPTYLKDRGTGVATSMFGTYIRRGELIVFVVNGEVARQAEPLRLAAQQARAKRMKGGDPRLARIAAGTRQQRRHALLHLVGSFVGEGDRED